MFVLKLLSRIEKMIENSICFIEPIGATRNHTHAMAHRPLRMIDRTKTTYSSNATIVPATNLLKNCSYFFICFFNEPRLYA